MTDTHAQIAGKGLDATGFTEDLAAELFNKVGTHIMAIVDLQVVDRSGPNVKDKRKVHLIIDGIEPAIMDETVAEHLRELTRTLYFNRAIDADQPTFDTGDGINPKVSDVIREGVRHRPHPFLPVDAANDNGICDVCGLIDSAGVHSTQDFLPDGDDEDQDADQGDDDPEDGWEYPAPEPHQAGDEPTVAEVLAAKERAAVPDPFTPTVA